MFLLNYLWTALCESLAWRNKHSGTSEPRSYARCDHQFSRAITRYGVSGRFEMGGPKVSSVDALRQSGYADG